MARVTPENSPHPRLDRRAAQQGAAADAAAAAAARAAAAAADDAQEGGASAGKKPRRFSFMRCVQTFIGIGLLYTLLIGSYPLEATKMTATFSVIYMAHHCGVAGFIKAGRAAAISAAAEGGDVPGLGDMKAECLEAIPSIGLFVLDFATKGRSTEVLEGIVAGSRASSA